MTKFKTSIISTTIAVALLCTTACSTMTESLGGEQNNSEIGVGVLVTPTALEVAAQAFVLGLESVGGTLGSAAATGIGVSGPGALLALIGTALYQLGQDEANIAGSLSALFTEALHSRTLGNGWLFQTLTQNMSDATDLEKGMFYASFSHEIGPETVQELIMNTMGNNLEAVSSSAMLFDTVVQTLAVQHGATITPISLNLADYDSVEQTAYALGAQVDLSLRSIANVSLQFSGGTDDITARNIAISQTYEAFVAKTVFISDAIVALSQVLAVDFTLEDLDNTNARNRIREEMATMNGYALAEFIKGCIQTARALLAAIAAGDSPFLAQFIRMLENLLALLKEALMQINSSEETEFLEAFCNLISAEPELLHSISSLGASLNNPANQNEYGAFQMSIVQEIIQGLVAKCGS